MQDFDGVNCYAYALRLHPVRTPDETWVAPMGLDVWDWIVEGILQEDLNGDIIVYFSQKTGEPVHMGVCDGDLVISKWREQGVRSHQVLGTPYGNITKRYSVPEREQLLETWETASKETMENLQAN